MVCWQKRRIISRSHNRALDHYPILRRSSANARCFLHEIRPYKYMFRTYLAQYDRIFIIESCTAKGGYGNENTYSKSEQGS